MTPTRKQRPERRQLRAGLYFRVSSEEQVDGYSLDAQRRATRAYCEAQDWVVAAEYRDEGKSARTDDLARRPAFAAMLADADAGLLDVIVVHKLDRFARNLRVTLETLERLNARDVAFVSISENMDFSTAIGKVILATLAAFAQYYSDNLSHETKKGKAERKAQGMHNGLLPFGVKKNEDGLAVPDPDTYPGLLLAFKHAAEGKSDRDVANELNAAGYRTTGNRGPNPFTKDTVRPMLQNRFYLGELPDGAGGWLPGKHAPMLDGALFAAAEQARATNRKTKAAASVPDHAQTYVLSGLALCGYCGGRLHMHRDRAGRARIYCYQGRQANACPQRSGYLAPYEEQLADYLRTFHLPDDYQTQIMTLLATTETERADDEQRRRAITARLERIKHLYSWGDLDRLTYQQERDALSAELATLRQAEDQSVVLAATASFLRDASGAWETATPEERNQIARLLFEKVVIKDDEVATVTVQPAFAPFFWLDCQANEGSVSNERKRRGSVKHDPTPTALPLPAAQRAA